MAFICDGDEEAVRSDKLAEEIAVTSEKSREELEGLEPFINGTRHCAQRWLDQIDVRVSYHAFPISPLAPAIHEPRSQALSSPEVVRRVTASAFQA